MTAPSHFFLRLSIISIILWLFADDGLAFISSGDEMCVYDILQVFGYNLTLWGLGKSIFNFHFRKHKIN